MARNPEGWDRVRLILQKAPLFLGGAVLLLLVLFSAHATAQQADPHGTESLDTKYCANCHDLHEAPEPRLQRLDKVHLMRSGDEKAVCYTCHNGTAAPPQLNVEAEFGDNGDGTSSKASSHPVADGTVVCSDCHSSHSKTENWIAPEELTEVVRLLRVKAGKAWGYMVNTLNLGWLESPSRIRLARPEDHCGGCHGPGSTLPGGDLLTNFMGSSHETTVVAPSPPLSPIKCNACHQWHGSDLPSLLQPQINGVPITDNNSLCFACHITGGSPPIPSGAFPGRAIFEQTKHSTVTASAVALVTLPGSGFAAGDCVNCHNTHGSEFADFRRANQNDLCFTCHDATGITLPAAYSYRGEQRYGFAAHGEDVTPFNVWPKLDETGFAIGTGGAQPGECINCHNPMGKDNGIGEPFPNLLLQWELKQGGSPAIQDSAEEMLCYGGSPLGAGGSPPIFGCHAVSYTYTDVFYGTGTRTSNIYNQFNPPLPLVITAPSGAKVNGRHDIDATAQNTYNPPAKVECDDCHNPHTNNRDYDYVNASKMSDPDDTNQNWTAEYDPASTFDFNGTSYSFAATDQDPTFGTLVPDLVAFCLKCHDDTLPGAVSFGSISPTFIALYYAAPSGSPPAVVDAHGRGDGRGGVEGTLKYPYFGALIGDSGEPPVPYAAMNCNDC
ncbi:MAG: cytochrome c3 family protein, partial [Terriglobia bacterium]